MPSKECSTDANFGILFAPMLKFQPESGTVVYCDYSGFTEPEMVKTRPVIVISKHRHHSKLLLIVPISTSAPSIFRDYQIELDPKFCSLYLNGERCWVKCDMVNVVSLERLNLLKDKRSGFRHAPNVGRPFLKMVIDAIDKAYYV